MATPKDLKSLAVLFVVFVCCIVLIVDTMEDFQAAAAQRAKYECQSNHTKCHPNSHCYGNDTSYVCMCPFGWNGDGLAGDDHSGCHRRQISKFVLIGFMFSIAVMGLMFIWVLVEFILNFIKLKTGVHGEALVPQAHPEVALVPVCTV